MRRNRKPGGHHRKRRLPGFIERSEPTEQSFMTQQMDVFRRPGFAQCGNRRLWSAVRLKKRSRGAMLNTVASGLEGVSMGLHVVRMLACSSGVNLLVAWFND